MEKRLDLKVGYTCNNNCRFCVVADKRKYGDLTTSILKSEMEKGRKSCSSIVLTGGEVTIRKDIFELVSHAKSLGFDPIQIQTNGRMFCSKDFCEKMIKAGASEFGPALHGHTPQLHDYLTRAPGSFRQTVQGIKNLKLLKQTILVNSVVTKPNYIHLPKMAGLFVRLNVDQFQFAFVHPAGNAWKNFDSIVPWASLAAPYIKEGLRIGELGGVKCMAEAMPLCLMQDYERFISEGYMPETELREKCISGVQITKMFSEARKEHGKAKFKKCTSCKHNAACEGPWAEYPQRRGDREFRPLK